MNKNIGHICLILILAMCVLVFAAFLYSFYKYDPVIVNAFSSLVMVCLTFFLVYNPWRERENKKEKRKEIEKHIYDLSELLERATKEVLEEFYRITSFYPDNEASVYDRMAQRYEKMRLDKLKEWTTEVVDYLEKEDLKMYKVFFDNIHEISDTSSIESYKILNKKRKELKEIIKDLYKIKNNT